MVKQMHNMLKKKGWIYGAFIQGGFCSLVFTKERKEIKKRKR